MHCSITSERIHGTPYPSNGPWTKTLFVMTILETLSSGKVCTGLVVQKSLGIQEFSYTLRDIRAYIQ